MSGGITFTIAVGIDGIAPTPEQLAAIKTSTTRTGVGSWDVTITGLPAGNWSGVFTFTDSSKVHATSVSTLLITVTAPPVPTPETPAPTPTPEPTPTPSS